MTLTLTFNVALREEGMKLRDFLRHHGISRRTLTKIKFDGGALFVNRKSSTVTTSLKKDDEVVVIFPKEEASPQVVRENVPICIHYEDDALLIVEKPVGLPTIPSRQSPNRSLASRVLAYFDASSIASDLHIVTRLDANTGGLVVIAKHSFIHHRCSEQIQNGELKRRYVALIERGTPLPSIIDLPIGRKDGSIIEREVRADGRRASTIVHDERSFHHVSLIEVELLTGRTHQIRVHTSAYGRPIVGDTLYGSRYAFPTGQALLCESISLIHPLTGIRCTWQLHRDNIQERWCQLLNEATRV